MSHLSKGDETQLYSGKQLDQLERQSEANSQSPNPYSTGQAWKPREEGMANSQFANVFPVKP